VKGRTEIPGLVEGTHIAYAEGNQENDRCLDYLQGKVKIDEYVTHHRKFAEINDGFHDMHVSCICRLLSLNF
jgi:S-(hydroxymethyl)glutathione dehydrogenase / alcohol dehydrogenase